MVVTPPLCQIKYINSMFVRVDTVTRGGKMKDFEAKRLELQEIKQIYKLNFKDGLNTEAKGRLSLYGITYYDSNLEAVLMAHNDPMVSTV